MDGVVITGLGVVSSLGHDVDQLRRGLANGDRALEPAPWSSERGAVWWSGVTGFDPARWMSPETEYETDLDTQFAVAAAAQAVEQAGGVPDPCRAAVVHGTTFAGTRALMRAQSALMCVGPDAVERGTLLRSSPSSPAAEIAMRFGLHGQQLTVSNACASSLDAIGTGARLVAERRADLVIAGGTDGGWTTADGHAAGLFEPALFHGRVREGMGAAGAPRGLAGIPFDARRRGAVIGEGSAMVVLERADTARARGATALADVLGHGSVVGGHRAPVSTGHWQAAAMRQALDDALVRPDEVAAVVAHAAASPTADRAEVRAINALFGREDLVVTSLKGHLGDAGAASGGMGLIAAVGALQEQRVPHVAGTEVLDPEVGFDVALTRPRSIPRGPLLVNAFAFTGHNACLTIGRR